MSRNKEREIKWNKFKTDRYREWQTKYPGLKQSTYISFETAKKIGLPLKQGDTREQDNKKFNQYYQCLLYTSDAADDSLHVERGSLRISNHKRKYRSRKRYVWGGMNG